MDGAPLPDFADGSICFPRVRAGPPFLPGPNFAPSLRYNTPPVCAGGRALAQHLAAGFRHAGVLASRSASALAQPTACAADGLDQRGFDSGTPTA